jgi:hypothetical protein
MMPFIGGVLFIGGAVYERTITTGRHTTNGRIIRPSQGSVQGPIQDLNAEMAVETEGARHAHLVSRNGSGNAVPYSTRE